MKAYTLNDIKKAAFVMKEIPNLTPRHRSLWEGLAYCYEWQRAHPEDTEDCKELAEKYINLFWGDDI